MERQGVQGPGVRRLAAGTIALVLAAAAVLPAREPALAVADTTTDHGPALLAALNAVRGVPVAYDAGLAAEASAKARRTRDIDTTWDHAYAEGKAYSFGIGYRPTITTGPAGRTIIHELEVRVGGPIAPMEAVQFALANGTIGNEELGYAPPITDPAYTRGGAGGFCDPYGCHWVLRLYGTSFIPAPAPPPPPPPADQPAPPPPAPAPGPSAPPQAPAGPAPAPDSGIGSPPAAAPAGGPGVAGSAARTAGDGAGPSPDGPQDEPAAQDAQPASGAAGTAGPRRDRAAAQAPDRIVDAAAHRSPEAAGESRNETGAVTAGRGGDDLPAVAAAAGGAAALLAAGAGGVLLVRRLRAR